MIYLAVEKRPYDVGNHKEYFMDTDEDLAKLPRNYTERDKKSYALICPGSTAMSIASGTVWMYTPSNTWEILGGK